MSNQLTINYQVQGTQFDSITWGYELHQCLEALQNAKYRFASTMKWAPHFYTLRKQWENDALWNSTLQAMELYGEPVKWGKRTYKYLYIGEYQYWHMLDAPEHAWTDPFTSNVINRAKIKKTDVSLSTTKL